MDYGNNMTQQELLTNISYSIRTPIHTIMGMADLAMAQADDPEAVKDYLQKIKDAGRMAADQLNELLGSTILSEDDIILRTEPCTALDIYEMVSMQSRVYLEGRNLNFTIDVADMMKSPFAADKIHVDKIMKSLISNAVKYTPDGGSIAFRAETVYGNGEQVWNRYTLTDTGIGITPEFCSRIFEPFAREKNDAEGSGLGMYLTKRLVDLMKGRISVSSRQGEGTTVTVELPGGITQRTDKLPKTVPQPLDLEILRGRRILLCEDNQFNCEMTAQLLENAGMLVECAGNGQEALERIQATPEYYYDAVLMDIRMPVMDGLEATRRIRALEREDTYVLPIVALTANAYDEDYQKSLSAGMDTHLCKPFSISTLLQRLAGFWSVYKVVE